MRRDLGWALVVIGFIGATLSFAMPGNSLQGTFIDSVWFTFIAIVLLIVGWQMTRNKT